MAKKHPLPDEDTLTTAARLNALLTRIDTAACALLTEMGWPSDPVAIYAVLKGEQAAPRTRTPGRAKQRARYAMFTRLSVRTLRQDLRGVDPLVTDAVMEALHLGGLASEVVLQTAKKQQSTRGGINRGKQKTTAAKAPRRDVEAKKYRRQWLASDELQSEFGYRSPVRYLKQQMGISTSTAQRILERITRQ